MRSAPEAGVTPLTARPDPLEASLGVISSSDDDSDDGWDEAPDGMRFFHAMLSSIGWLRESTQVRDFAFASCSALWHVCVVSAVQ